jgi:hypothetical protein
MAISVTSTGSQWKILTGTDEEIVNYAMLSGLGTPYGFSAGTVGSVVFLYQE